jgi:hypothetical protein
MRGFEDERIKRWLFERPGRNSLLVSGVFFVFFLLIFHPRFDTNDDVRQAMIASGVGIADHPDPHILFPHIYLGEMLSTAYSYLPTIPWYGMMLYLGLFVGVWMLVWVLLKKEKSPWLWLLWAALPLMMNVQYTGVAFLLGMGGVVAGLNLFDSGKSNRFGFRHIILAVALIIASMIRWEAFLLVLGLTGVVFLLNGTERRRGGELVFGLLVVLGIAFGLHIADNHHYGNHADWKEFRKQNALRGEITDYDHIPFNEKTASLYQEIGWDESAFQLYQSWFLADTAVQAIEKVGQLVAAKKWSWRWDTDRLKKRLISLPSQNLFAGLLLLPMLLGFFHLNKKDKRKFILLFFFASSLLLYLAFDQWLHNRISLPVMAFLLFWVFYYQEKTWQKAAKIAMLSFSMLYFSAYLYRDFQEKKRMDIAEQQLEALHVDNKKLVAIWADSFPYEYVFRPFRENRDLFENLSLLPLGMTVYTPFYGQKMQKHGFSDIHKALRDSNTVLIARPELLPAYQQFMAKYYAQEIQFEEVLSEKNIAFYVWKLK